jgi:regulator of nucleoside diphosphate kinase
MTIEQEITRQQDMETPVPILITDRDWLRLRQMMAELPDRRQPAIDFLHRELARAVVYPSRSIPPNVVTMNSRVTFRIGDGKVPDSGVLVYPEDYVADHRQISVTSLVGAALLGLRSGAGILHHSLDGHQMQVFVEEVSYQPQAAARG